MLFILFSRAKKVWRWYLQLRAYDSVHFFFFFFTPVLKYLERVDCISNFVGLLRVLQSIAVKKRQTRSTKKKKISKHQITRWFLCDEEFISHARRERQFWTRVHRFLFFFLLYFGLKRSVTWFTDYTFSFTKQEKHL